MTTSDTPTHYDTLIIGAGQSGVLAIALGKAGRKTILIERAQAGGTCTNRGCTPSKTLVASARIAYLARRAGDFGVRTGPVEIDFLLIQQQSKSKPRWLCPDSVKPKGCSPWRCILVFVMP